MGSLKSATSSRGIGDLEGLPDTLITTAMRDWLRTHHLIPGPSQSCVRDYAGFSATAR
jgi:hypothetical protein